MAGPAELDVQSLAALLVRWCIAPPSPAEPSLPQVEKRQQHQQQRNGANAPGGHLVAGHLGHGHRHAAGMDDGSVAAWVKWTAGKVELVWLTQHESTQARRAAVVAELQALTQQTKSEVVSSEGCCLLAPPARVWGCTGSLLYGPRVNAHQAWPKTFKPLRQRAVPAKSLITCSAPGHGHAG